MNNGLRIYIISQTKALEINMERKTLYKRRKAFLLTNLKYTLFFVLLISYLFNNTLWAEGNMPILQLKGMISRMIIIGFDQEELSKDSHFAAEIGQYCPGGIILFDRDFYKPKKTKNIRSPSQLRRLIEQIYSYASRPILIVVDQEGGRVARLKPEDGFISTPSAAYIGKQDNADMAKEVYLNLAQQLSDMGINCDLAPVLDLAINQDNYVISGLERSYGRSPQKVIRYARIFYDALHSKGIISALKHFPGHGSSADDSHKGFVDITDSWDPIELEPYERLIKEGRADMVMTAHLFNRHLDPLYPASLSYKVNTLLLRGKLGFKGVIISDDMQMKAISEHYSLSQAVTLSINAGVNMLIFGNQLGKISLTDIVELIYEEVKKGNISVDKIIESNRLIDGLFTELPPSGI